MSDLAVPDTRRRSRSKTPFVLRSQCDKDNCTETDHIHSHVKVAPVVETIVEEDANTNARAKTRNTRQTVSVSTAEAPIAPSQQNTTNSEQSVAESRTSSVTATTVVTTTSSVKTVTGKSTTRAGAEYAAPSTTTLRSSAVSKEQSQNEQNTFFEESTSHDNIQTSTPIRNTKHTQLLSSTTLTSPIAVDTETINDHIAYREYRDAGEYWNKYPKTDYTYSKLSPHRRELAPGVVAMPNMSRRSLEHHHSRVDQMAAANPEMESYIRTRYQARQFAAQNRRQELLYDSQDSQDEVDVVNTSYRSTRTTVTRTSSTSLFQRIIFVRWITTVASWFWETITSRFRENRHTNVYYSRVEEKGWFRRFTSAVSSSVWSVVQFVYLTISSVLFLDSWLLKSKTSGGSAKKRFLLLLLILLPLLLLAAWRLSAADDPERTGIRFRLPAIPLGLPIALSAFSSFDFHTLNWPSWPSQAGSAPPPHDPSITDAQYRDLLAHLSRYVESLVEQKTGASEQKLSESLVVNIARTVNEHISNNRLDLSDVDIDRIADKVRAHLEHERSTSTEVPFVFTNENVVHVSKLVKEHIAQSTGPEQASSNVLDVDSILLQILSSAKLSDIIDKRILQHTRSDSQLIVEQQQLIDALRREIDTINIKLEQSENTGKHIQQSIISLQSSQENLENTFSQFARENEQRLAALLVGIDDRILQAGDRHIAGVESRVKILLMDILGYKSHSGETPDDVDLKGWIQNVFVAKDMLEQHLDAVRVQSDVRMHEEINRSAGILMKDIGDQIREQTVVLIERNNVEVLGVAEGSGSTGRAAIDLNVDEIKRIVKEALAVYDADKTGLVDYALESAGGEIISTRCTETYHTKTAQISIFGIPLWYPSNTPRTAISPTVQPGQCWAFQGFPGFLVLKLNAYIHVTGFTIEHIPKSLSPNGKIDSAPKSFTVWGLEGEDDHEPLQFGTYEFVDDDVSNLQYFPVQAADIERLHNIVELRIESNHGNTDYSCLYRFRVHGTPERG